jgi:hypothetical protein
MNADYTLSERIALSAVFATWDIDMTFQEILAALKGDRDFDGAMKQHYATELHELLKGVPVSTWRKVAASRLEMHEQSARMVLETEKIRQKTNHPDGFTHCLHGPMGGGRHFRVRFEQAQIAITPDGHSTFDTDHGRPITIWLDRRGVPVVSVWGDINQLNPTHIIIMDGSSREMSLEWAQNEMWNLLDQVPEDQQEVVWRQAVGEWLLGYMSDIEYFLSRRGKGDLLSGLNASELRELRPFLAKAVGQFNGSAK